MTVTTATAEEKVTSQSAQLPSGRLLSVDVLRGFCVAGMVLVNFPADWTLRYRQLGHADWDGATATDMIFPMFLFLAGMSMAMSFASRVRSGQSRASLARHVLTRSLILLALGLLLNAFPTFDWRMLHIPGVLQRIALCYLAGGLWTLATARTDSQSGFAVNAWAVGAFAVGVLAGVWALIRFVPVAGYGSWRFDHDGNLGAAIDRAIFGTNHLSNWGGPQRMWDADGLLSCITSIPNLLLGVLAAVWIVKRRSRPVLAMLLGAAVLVAAALLLNPFLVINRKIWTDSFTLLSGGISLGIFALAYWLLDVVPDAILLPRWRSLLTPALVYGSNAILGFSLYTILLGLHGRYYLPSSHGPANWLPGAAYAWLSRTIDPYNASLLYGVTMTGVVCALLWPLYRRRIFLRL